MVAQFALRLVCGISLMWILMPRDRITSGFFRIQMLLTVGLSALATIAIVPFFLQSDQQPLLSTRVARMLLGGTTCVAYAGSILWTLDRRGPGTVCIWSVAILSTGTLVGCSISPSMLLTETGIVIVLSEIAASLLIGGATAGMLLGHWYLTAPTMSIDPLSRVNNCFGLAALLRLGTALCGLWLAWPKLERGTTSVWLSLHWIAGILGPIILCAMVQRILRYRNTQAATGVLFVGVIVSFIGELSATLASRELRFPL